MSVALVPDYLISSNGLPKFNREKYKKTDRNQMETRIQQVPIKNFAAPVQQQQIRNVARVSYFDNKKLLSKRESSEIRVVGTTTASTISSHQSAKINCRGGNKFIITDKDIKCSINRAIKMSQSSSSNRHEISNNSNETLDNRLAYQPRYSNEICGRHETEFLVLDF